MALNIVPTPRRSTQPVPAQPYVVRVLVPCYTESLEIVQKTVLAAANADLPPLACRTVYLLDDGKDVSKAAWVAEQVKHVCRLETSSHMGEICRY